MRSVQLGLMSLMTLGAKQLLRNGTAVTQSLAYKGKEGEPFRLAYGSCYGLVNFYTDIFRSINEYQPHVWLWLGDAAYTDDIMGSCKGLIGSYIMTGKGDNTMPPEFVKQQY